jgi:membrane-bound ClpP family serine protease
MFLDTTEEAMSNKAKGTLLGILFSLGAIAIWVGLAMAGWVAGIAGAFMGVFFIMGYRVFNKDRKGKYPSVVACILIVVEVFVATLITLAIDANTYGMTLGYALAYDVVVSDTITNVVVGLLLSCAVFAGFLIRSGGGFRVNAADVSQDVIEEPVAVQNVEVAAGEKDTNVLDKKA